MAVNAAPCSHAVIVGGGYVGLGTAASLRALGLDVTVLEAAERVPVPTGVCVGAGGGQQSAPQQQNLD